MLNVGTIDAAEVTRESDPLPRVPRIAKVGKPFGNSLGESEAKNG